MLVPQRTLCPITVLGHGTRLGAGTVGRDVLLHSAAAQARAQAQVHYEDMNV